jgi:hypothetical protein
MLAEPELMSGLAELNELATEIRLRHRSLIQTLGIDVVEGGVVIHGRAYTFYGKQIALYEILRRFAVVANRIEVYPRHSRTQWSSLTCRAPLG